MFYVIELYQESQSLVFMQITESSLTCQIKPMPKSPNTGRQEWDFVLAHFYILFNEVL